jgi:hypothetical protein
MRVRGIECGAAVSSAEAIDKVPHKVHQLLELMTSPPLPAVLAAMQRDAPLTSSWYVLERSITYCTGCLAWLHKQVSAVVNFMILLKLL